MSVQSFAEESKQYSQLKHLIIEGNHKNALQILEEIKSKLSDEEILLYNLLKCELLFQQGLLEEVVKLTERIYQESIKLDKPIISLKALIKMSESLIFSSDITKTKQIFKQIDDLQELYIQKQSLKYKKIEANISYVKGLFYGWLIGEVDKSLEFLEPSISFLEELGENFEIIKPLIIKAIVVGTLKREPDDAIKILERSSKLSEKFNYKLTSALSLEILGLLYGLRDIDYGIQLLEQSLILFQELDNKFFITFVLNYIGMAYIEKGDLNKALEYSEQALVHAREINNKRQILEIIMNLASIYGFKGENEQAIHLYVQGLEICKEFNHKLGMAVVFNDMSWAYRTAGDLERAIECVESSIKIHNELGLLKAEANNYDFLIQFLIDKGELGRAQKALEELEQMKYQLNDDFTNNIYQFNKALLLKNSSRARDRGKAEEILKQFIKKENIDYPLKVRALLNLSELLLTELAMTNDLEVLEELNSYTNQLLEFAEKSHSYAIFAETYFLKAKLSLLTLDVKIARKFLTQAQRIAERFGLNQLATKISAEHNNLREKLDIWKDLEKKEFSLSERIKLAGLDTHMKDVLQKSAMLTTQISERKITIHREQKVCLICKGEISGFMYACNCDALYCESCARALTDLENACWVCSAPIDISKPSKPYKEEKLKEKDIIKKEYKKS